MSEVFNILDNRIKELAVSRFTTKVGKLSSSFCSANKFRETLHIKLRGIISYRKTFRLSFSSKEISKKIKCRYVSIRRSKNSWMLEPNGPHKLWKHRDGSIIEIPIAKLLTGKEKIEIKKSNKTTKVILNKNFCLGNFTQNARSFLNPLYENKDVPKDIVWISFQLNRRRNKGDRIILTRKVIYNLSKKKEVRVLYQKSNKGIVLRFTKDRLRGRKLCPTRIRKNQYFVEIAFPPPLQRFLRNKIGIPLKEFGLKESDFTDNKTEKELLDSLKSKNIDVYSGTTQTLGDIFFKDYNGFIEITTWKPLENQLKSRHSITPLQVRGRMFEAEHMSIHRKLKPNFIIIDERWKSNKHIQKEAKEMEKHKVYTIFTNFKNNWSNKVADVICKKLK